MKKITILSGKGGVGKSSITASLAVALSLNNKIICADCDVDAANLGLALGLKQDDSGKDEMITTNQKAVFDKDKCISCRKCLESCHFDAISWKDNKPELKQFGCEGCGVCQLVCPADAVSLIDIYNAKVGCRKTKYGFSVVSGQVEMGESGSGKVVAAVKSLAEKQSNGAEIMLIDSAAGIGCPVIASVTGSDYVIAVTEPSPSGFSDLKRALEVVRHFRIRSGIIINKFDINKEYAEKIEEFAKNHNIKILLKFSYDRCFVDALVNMTPVIEYNPKYLPKFNELIDSLKSELI